LLGEYKGTPTIRLFVPKRKPKKAGSVSEKTVLDYQHGERTSKDMKTFLEHQLPSYSERVKFGREDYDRFSRKAKRFGLPLVVVFTTKTKTSTSIKWLSAEYRRKLLILEVPPTDKNKGLREELFLGSSDEADDAASLYVVAPDGTVHTYEGDSFARRKLQDFLKGHALSKPALEPLPEPAARNAAANATTPEEEIPQTDETKPSNTNNKHDEF